MKSANPVVIKSYAFAKQIIFVYKAICNDKKEFILSKQLLRSGTSIGANVEEAQGAQSKKDFFAKMAISYKEAREIRYWVNLLHDTGFLTFEQFDLLNRDCEELLKIIGSIQRSIKNN